MQNLILRTYKLKVEKKLKTHLMKIFIKTTFYQVKLIECGTLGENVSIQLIISFVSD